MNGEPHGARSAPRVMQPLALPRSLPDAARNGRGLTEPQQRFVIAFTTNPAAVGNASAAARLAGYSEHSAREIGRQLLDKPHIQDAIRESNERLISSTMATKAIALLGRVIEDESVPMKTRVDAARTILDRAGFSALPPIAPNRLSDKMLSEMTAAELRETMRQAKAEMDKAAKGVTVIDQAPGVAESQTISGEAEIVDSTIEGTRQ